MLKKRPMQIYVAKARSKLSISQINLLDKKS